AEVTHDIFLRLLDRGYVYRDSMQSMFCPKDQRFLPDRYIQGTCPNCGYDKARGDQCDNCGRPWNPTDLIDPRCQLCGTTPELRETEHYFLKLSALNQQLLDWVGRQSHWRPSVLNFTRNFLQEGLRDRAITRDIEWGVSVPVEGFEDKRIYVWFEAVIGYLSATKEWAQRQGDPERWRDFWERPCKSYYFIGKDNIPFHTIIWPAMLMGYGDLNVPYDVPANEFLTIEGRKLSTSQNWAVWLPDYAERYDPDPLRYVLSINMPETSDADFSWHQLVQRNNDELVAAYGNLVHRVLTLTHRNFAGRVPAPGALDDLDRELLARLDATFEEVDAAIGACRFKEAIRLNMELARATNRYLEERSPWKTIREDRERTGTTLFVALAVIAGLRTLLYPFLPFSSEKLHRLLGFSGTIEADGWRPRRPEAGQALPVPEALFTKLDESVIERETARLGRPAGE
ncbi:MAG TPA: methionine--tRNA ligase, partial [Dehalococcoidia bacterium]|nr:methionine--tRNA ligase [Dehalococcoidia bacterium]